MSKKMTHVSQIITIPEGFFGHLSRHYSKDPATLVWECPICGVIVPIAQANGFMRRSCACQKAQRVEEELAQVRVEIQQSRASHVASKTYTWLGPQFSEEGLEEQTFTSFDFTRQPQSGRFHLILEQTKAFTQSIKDDPKYCRNILFYGTWGTGKTHLAAAILNDLREAGVPCLFTTAQGLLDAIYDKIGQHQSTAVLMAKAADTRVLVIDDLDKLHIPQTTEGKFQKKVLFDILDKRYKRKLPTIITMNEIDPAPYVGDAIASRLQVGLITLQMNGKDLRQTRII